MDFFAGEVVRELTGWQPSTGNSTARAKETKSTFFITRVSNLIFRKRSMVDHPSDVFACTLGICQKNPGGGPG